MKIYLKNPFNLWYNTMQTLKVSSEVLKNVIKGKISNYCKTPCYTHIIPNTAENLGEKKLN